MNNPIPLDELKLNVEELRWCCDINSYDYLKTGIIPRITGTVGQKRALDAIDLGLEISSPGYNVFVTGQPGSGRSYTIKTLLKQIDSRISPAKDRCYVNNFSDPSRPVLIELPSGKGKILKIEMKRLLEAAQTKLTATFEEENFRQERDKLTEKYQSHIKAMFSEFEDRIKADNLAIVSVQRGPVTIPDIYPLVDSKPASFDDLETGELAGRFTDEELAKLKEKVEKYKSDLQNLLQEERKQAKALNNDMKELEQTFARAVLEILVSNVRDEFTTEEKVQQYLDSVLNNMLENLEDFQKNEEEKNPLMMMQKRPKSRAYEVNILLDTSEKSDPPIVIETNPTFTNLFGTIEREIDRSGGGVTDFTKIKAGSLLRADGGYLVLNIKDILVEPGIWRNLVRSLKTEQLEIQTPETALMLAPSVVKPDPIPIKLKVILIGDERYYQLLSYYEEDFQKIFKVKAEFDSSTSITAIHLREFAAVINNLVSNEKLLKFNPLGYAAIIEEAVRIAGRKSKISTRFGEIANIIRESSYWAKKEDKDIIDREDVLNAIKAREERHRLIDEKYQEMIMEGMLLVSTDGKRTGQINGLAVFGSDHYFGKPSRITVSTGVGKAGIINIEREVRMSGSIHDKGVMILSGYLREKYAFRMPLALSASITFEQNYGGIDGDSATIAETICLLSSISKIPIRQDIAVTGSMNQKGDSQAIGGVNHKIEGFFALCKERGLTGNQGVVIPKSNVNDLMLRENVVKACKEEKFAVYNVTSIDEAIEIFFGMPAGEIDEKTGLYPEGTVHHAVYKRLKELANAGTEEPSVIKEIEAKGTMPSNIPEPPKDPPPPGP